LERRAKPILLKFWKFYWTKTNWPRIGDKKWHCYFHRFI